MTAHVVLDANTYVETNYGRSEKFKSFLDFMRKIEGRILLLASVYRKK